MPAASRRSRSTLTSFDPQTGARRPRWFVVLSAVVGLVLALAGAVVGVSAASAHTPTFSTDCYGFSVRLDWYNGSADNTVTVVVNDATVVDREAFRGSYANAFQFADPTVVNTWTVRVAAHDDPTGTRGWSFEQSGQSTPCAAPDVTLEATACDTVGGSTTLTATIGDLNAGESYTGRLSRDGVLVETFPATTAGKTWAGLEAGRTYRVSVTNDARPGLTREVELATVGCPQNGDLSVAVTQCSAADSSNAAVTVTASALVAGREYAAVVQKGDSSYGSYSFFATGAETEFTIALPENVEGMVVVLTDVAAGTTVTSTGFSTSSCPDVPAAPAVSSTACSAVDGALEVTVVLDGLVPGRAYDVQIDGVVVDSLVAASSTEEPRTYAVAAGEHVVTVVDSAAPGVSASSDPIVVAECPTQPTVAFVAVRQCTEPGSDAAVTVSFAGLAEGRSYRLAVTLDDVALPASGDTVAAGAPDLELTGLTPGGTVVVTVTDEAAPDVKSAASVTLEPCPGTPAVTLELRCLLVEGASIVSATVDDLRDGDEYLVEIRATEDAGAAAPARMGPVLESRQMVASGSRGSAEFQVPNGVEYVVTATNVANSAVTGSARVFAAVCDLPTFPFPPDMELPTLAFTGSDPTLPMLAALALVQAGVALLAFSALTRRRRRRA